MDLRQTLLLYLLLGGGVAIGFAARSSDKGRAWATILAAWVFWPLFVPLLLSTDEELPAETSSITGETIDTRLARGCELLDRLVATSPALNIPVLPEQVARIKSLWSERAVWLGETGLLIQSLKAAHTPETSSKTAPMTQQVDELECMQISTEHALNQSLNSIDELAVLIQLLKAPGVDRTAGLERIEGVLKAILELEAE